MMAAPDLPEPLIHRIQSLLTTKKAGKTAVLSRSWLNAWSTRPSIDLDQSLFSTHYSIVRQIEEESLFTAFAAETFRRYEDLDLRIHSFSLRLIRWNDRLSDLAAEWTLRALKLGAADFTFRSDDFYFRSDEHRDFSLPIHLVVGSDYAVRSLGLEGASLPKSIECRGLKSLSLSNMSLSIDSLFHAISCCPLIEHLSLIDVLSGRSYFFGDYYKRGAAGSTIDLPNLTSLNLGSIHVNNLRNLFQDDGLSVSKFPKLKELTLNLFFIDEDTEMTIVILSRSLEIFNLTIEWIGECGSPRAKLEIDALSIRKFTFDGCVVPKFTFRSSSKSRDGILECRVSVSNRNYLCADWLCELREFLTSVAGSKISLCLKLRDSRIFDYLPGDIECLNVCELEDLTIDSRGLQRTSFYAVLDVMFRMCHPKTITQYEIPPKDKNMFDDNEDFKTNRKNDAILCRVLEQGMQGKFGLSPFQYMYGLRELEEINPQKLCDDQVMWMPQTFDSVLDSTSDDRPSRFRFNLKWKPLVAT